MISSFKELSLNKYLMQALDALGFSKPTDIQAKAIPLLLEKDTIDFHGQAQTGTGKTLAFGIPLLQRIQSNHKGVQALIVAPTRELVMQICQSLQDVAKYADVSIFPVYGGVSMVDQIRALKKGVQIVVGTPGRLNDHLRRKTMSLNQLNTLVLDEADIMLDMGFKEEIDEILHFAPENRNIWLFSATVKQGIEDLKKHMKDVVSVRVSASDVGAKQVKQYFCVVSSRDRLAALCRFIDKTPSFYGFIFCPTKILTSEVAEALLKRGYKASALHGDMNQAARNKTIKRFKDKEFSILVATDVAARGIDVVDATHVINYELPEDQESYVHRIGRTGRAGREGTAITFVNKGDLRSVKRLEYKFKVSVEPVDVPSADEIAQVRLQEAAEYLTLACHRSKNTGTYVDQLRTLVTEYEHPDLVNAVVNSLHEIFFKHLKQEKDISFIPAVEVKKSMNDPRGDSRNDRGEYRERRGERRGDRRGGDRGDRGGDRRDYRTEKEMTGDFQELFLNVGSDDGITKRDLLSFLETNVRLSVQDLGKIKLIKQRAFISVPAAMTNRVIQSLDNKSLGGRTVRVRRAND